MVWGELNSKKITPKKITIWPTGIGIDQAKHIGGTTMTIKEFVENTTIPAPGRGVPIAALRRVYQQAQGKISRSSFLIALTDANFPVVAERDRCFLVGRELVPEPVPV